MQPHEEQIIHLPDGRMLGYAEYGASDGKPLIYCHGWPSSRIEARARGADALGKRFHLRIIAIDRPGYGLSTFKPRRRFLDWPNDVCCLADRMRLGIFSVLSYSAGSPYALACAAKIPDRLEKVGVVSGLGQPLSAPGATQGMPTAMMWQSARIHPRLTASLFHVMRGTLEKAPRDQLPANAKQAMMAEVDFAYIAEHTWINGANLDGGVEALRQGGYGPAYDASLYWKPWGFDLKDISIPVQLWHGGEDLNAPYEAHGCHLANTIPKARPKFYPGEGHISLIHKYAEEIFAAMC